MPSQSISLGARPFGSVNSDPWVGAVLIDSALVAGGGVAYLRWIDRDNRKGGLASVHMRLSARADGHPADSGPDFTPTLERAARAFTFAEAGGRGSVTLRGPLHPDNAAADDDDPYLWTPPDDDGRAFRGWAAGLRDGVVTLTLDDGVVSPVATGDVANRAPLGAGLLAADGSGLLAGAAAAAQRLSDALRIERGSYPLLRDYGSLAGESLDRRPSAIFAAVAEAIAHAPNGLSDITLRSVRIGRADPGAVVVDVDAEWSSAGSAAPTPISVRAQLAGGA